MPRYYPLSSVKPVTWEVPNQAALASVVADPGNIGGIARLADTGILMELMAVAHDGTFTWSPYGLDAVVPIATQPGTTRTLSTADAGAYIRCTSGSATTITLPKDATAAIPVGTQVDFFQAGAGAVSFAAESGATVNAAALGISDQYKAATAIKVAVNTWDLIGALA